MYGSHKPRSYRSTEGCCICKAKTSSSRFTDSRKYEKDTMLCFDLKYPRQGEICNACVLLVKRFKRLPYGSTKNWSHMVDSKAGIGPGCSKTQTKYKSERISSRSALASNAVNNYDGSSTSSGFVGGAGSGVGNTSHTVNDMPYLPEKFSKIFKKAKKMKDSATTSGHTSKRKSTNNGWSQNSSHSLATTPDSCDSDYEDTRIHGSLTGNHQGGSGTVVQFQTQTRASASRAQAAAEARKRLLKMGTKRRKLSTPRKYRRSTAREESLEFFNEEEWQERKSCCGMVYECAALGGALLINTDTFKPCEQHRKIIVDKRQIDLNTAATTATLENKTNTVMPLQKTIIQTVPAVVQLKPPSQASCLPTMTATTSSTPVLKKHHLFFKRQSECFPRGDMVTITHSTTNNDTISATTHDVDIIKTESEFNVPSSQQQHPQLNKSSSNIMNNSLQRHNENINSKIPASSSSTTISAASSMALSISVTSSTPSTMPQMPKHSLAKVTTISPTLMSGSTTITNCSSNTSAMSLSKSNGFMHKIKTADTGKVVKHSLEKFNTAVRLKNSDMHDVVKPIIKTVDKSYILAKPQAQANAITLNNATNNNNTIPTAVTSASTAAATQQYQSLATYNVTAQQQQQQQPTLTASLSASSPTSSTSTKFSDNSSDSGFDENVLDRKSASPLAEDCDKKSLTRPGVQAVRLSTGVLLVGQPQNLILACNEASAHIVQSRKQGSLASNARSNNNYHHPTTTPAKIAQISMTNQHAASSSSSSPSSLVGVTSSMSLAAQAKMRAIYNNSNTIQHENGITTIVPASSLAATTQTAAMQNIAPSTVTITPAPPVGTTQFNTQNVISRKLTTANIINLQSNTNSHNNSNNMSTSNNHHHHHQNHQQQLNHN